MKSVCVGVLSIIELKMHGETLKFWTCFGTQCWRVCLEEENKTMRNIFGKIHN